MLFVFGGNTDPGGFTQTIRTTYRYTPSSNTWKTLAPMPTPRLSPGATATSKLAYVIGGYNPQSSYVGVTEAYSFSANTWSAKAVIANGRDTMSVGLGKNGMIYAIGGYGYGAAATNSFSTEVDQYNPATNTWTRLADAPIARADAAVTVINGQIYVMGGTDQTGATISRVDVYTP
jgi:N-acetylneuraminic acid mutarotase